MIRYVNGPTSHTRKVEVTVTVSQVFMYYVVKGIRRSFANEENSFLYYEVGHNIDEWSSG